MTLHLKMFNDAPWWTGGAALSDVSREVRCHLTDVFADRDGIRPLVVDLAIVSLVAGLVSV